MDEWRVEFEFPFSYFDLLCLGKLRVAVIVATVVVHFNEYNVATCVWALRSESRTVLLVLSR